MKEKILKTLKSKLMFAGVLNLLIMSFCVLVTAFSYANSKDFYNSIFVCQNHYYYSSNINYILAVVVGTLQYALTDINAYVLVEVGFSFAAFTSITYVFADKYSYRKAFVFSMVINILFALDHYSRIDGGKTSALLLTGGFLLVLNAVRNKRYTLPFWAGVAEIACGSFYNFESFFVALAFAVAFFLGDMIAKKKVRLGFQKFFWYFLPFLLSFLLVTLVTAGLHQFSYSINHSSEESANYYEYSSLKDSIDSLPFPDYKEHEEEFAEVGISNDSEYELLKNGYYDDSRMLNLSAMQLVSNIQEAESRKTVLYAAGTLLEDTWSHIMCMDSLLFATAVFLMISGVFILYHKNRFSFFPLFYAVAAVAAGITVRYLFDNSPFRSYGICLMMLVLLIYSFNFEISRRFSLIEKLRKSHGYMILSCLVLIALFGSYTTMYMLSTPDREGDAPWSLITEINRKPDCYYVMDTASKDKFDRYTENYLHPMWGFRPGYLENLDSFGYHHNYELLRKRNLSYNIYEALLTNRKIYVVDEYITFKKEKYFNINYGKKYENIYYQLVKELDNYKIYEVVVER